MILLCEIMSLYVTETSPRMSIPPEYEVVVWDNSRRPYDAGVFGRYLGIVEATRPVIVFQDDEQLF